MGKSYTTTDITNINDESALNAVTGVRGDGNTISVLDGNSIKEALGFASRVGDNTSNNIGQVLGVIDSVASKAMQNSIDSGNKVIQSLQSGLSNANNAIQTAYTKANSGGIDPQMLLFGVVGLVALLIWKK